MVFVGVGVWVREELNASIHTVSGWGQSGVNLAPAWRLRDVYE